MMHAPDIETAIIGGGVVGLAIAVACAKKGQETYVFERNGDVGQETSSRSSEVIHAGIYYPQGSLKANACVAGRIRLYEFAAENSVPAEKVGKLIVATTESEIATLKKFQAAARANGVDDLRWLTAAEVNALEPEVRCVAGLLSPSTGIVDSHALMKALEGHLQANGGSVVLQTTLQKAQCLPNGNFELSFASGSDTSRLTARNLVVAAGLGMAALRGLIPYSEGYEPPRTHFAKGHYFTLQGRAPFQHLIYPVPVPGGLGTHLTLDMQGAARFGPDVQWIDRIDYSFDDPDGSRRADFEQAIRRYWPSLPNAALEQGYTGIRPKVSGKDEPAADFLIHGPETHGIARMVALYGIESPGLTSSLAIADICAEKLVP
ncbi:MAG: NAD(P)/FAD-dependent oxidoreductase [Hyphomicrobium sp.]